jgi:hypothetical protein
VLYGIGEAGFAVSEQSSGGVGYSVRREDVYELPKVKHNITITHILSKDADFIVPDSRSGWIELLRKTLEAFFVTEAIL